MEGLHFFPGANELFPEVGYLEHLHRHIFFIEAEKEVFHDNRDKEFILFKRTIQEYLKTRFFEQESNCLNFANMSCEMIARDLLETFDLTSCIVSEDNENGAKIIK